MVRERRHPQGDSSARWLCRLRNRGVKGRNQLQTRAQGPDPTWRPHPDVKDRGEGLRTRSVQPFSPGPGARPHAPRPGPRRHAGFPGPPADPPRPRLRPAPQRRRPPGNTRAHRHRSAALPAATPATTSFRAKTGSRDPPEPGKRLKEHCVMTLASSA